MDKPNILSVSSNKNGLKNLSDTSSSDDSDDIDIDEENSNNLNEDPDFDNKNNSNGLNDSLELTKNVSDSANSNIDDQNKHVTKNILIYDKPVSRKYIFEKIKEFQVNTAKIISSKNKNKYKKLVKNLNDNFKQFLSNNEYFVNIDTLFPKEKINKKEKKDVIQILNESLDIDENKSLKISEKKLNTLEEAKNFIDDYYKNFLNESKKIKKSSIVLAINGGFYLSQIKEMCKNQQKKLKNNERREYKFELFIKTCKNVKWTYPYIQFLIKLYKLSKEFPKLKLVNVNLEFLKNNFKAVKDGVKADSDFWKQENLS